MPVCWEHIIIIRTDSVDKNEKRKGIEVKSASLSFFAVKEGKAETGHIRFLPVQNIDYSSSFAHLRTVLVL